MTGLFLISLLLSPTVPTSVAVSTGQDSSRLSAAADQIIFKGIPANFPTDLVQLERRFGKPSSVKTEPVIDPDTHKTIAIQNRFSFKGLVIEISDFLPDKWLFSVELSDNRWRFPSKLKIGDSRQDVIRLLGQPKGGVGAEFTYICHLCGFGDRIFVRFKGEKITTIRWEFYRDD